MRGRPRPSSSEGVWIFVTPRWADADSDNQVQHRDSDISLITHLSTRFSLFTAGKIPAPPADASVARASTAVRKQKPLSKTELEYVSFLYHNTNKDRIPTAEKYETTMVQSRNVREKFRVLKDVTEGLFCDLVVHIVRAPYDEGNKMTFWVSDYTENQAFYNFSVNATDSMWFEDGDRYGYLAKSGKKSAENRGDEEGPYGKRSMQITCWEPHASAIRESSISKGTWVLMKNVHIKYGRNASNLEGYLREDLGAYGVKIGIFALDSTDRESMDPRHLQALKRHRDYDRARRSQLKEIGEAAKAGQKRKSQGVAEEQTPASNSTSRRKARRKAKERAAQKAPDEQNGAEELEVVGVAPTPNLNSSGTSLLIFCFECCHFAINTLSEMRKSQGAAEQSIRNTQTSNSRNRHPRRGRSSTFAIRQRQPSCGRSGNRLSALQLNKLCLPEEVLQV